MSFFEDDQLTLILDAYFGNSGDVAGVPTTYYIALFTTTPDTDGTGGVEATYTDYARFPVTNDATEFPNAAGSPPVKSNANIWDFGVAGSASADPILSVGFYDDPTAGDLWAVVDTAAPVPINNGADVKVPATTLDLTGCA